MKANPCIQSIRPFIFVVPCQLPKLRCSFQVKNGILMRSPRPKRGGEIKNLGPQARMVGVFVKGFVLQTSP